MIPSNSSVLSTLKVSKLLALIRLALRSPFGSATKYFPWCDLKLKNPLPLSKTVNFSWARKCPLLAFTSPFVSATKYLLNPLLKPTVFLLTNVAVQVSNWPFLFWLALACPFFSALTYLPWKDLIVTWQGLWSSQPNKFFSPETICENNIFYCWPEITSIVLNIIRLLKVTIL